MKSGNTYTSDAAFVPFTTLNCTFNPHPSDQCNDTYVKNGSFDASKSASVRSNAARPSYTIGVALTIAGRQVEIAKTKVLRLKGFMASEWHLML